VGRKPKSAEVRARFFRARASGATLRQAAAAAGVSRTTGHYWLAQSGGVRPRQRRPRPALRLSLEEREAISRGLAAGWTLTAIAASLGRATSTVSRDVARNIGINGYRGSGRAARDRPDGPATAREAGRPTRCCVGMWRTSWRCAGPRLRSTAAWSSSSRRTCACGCPTRRSTPPCSYRPRACCARS
jgi:transposase